MSAVIESAGLTKYYGTTCHVEDLDVRVDRGMTYGFLGPNGAGKTTTIRCIAAAVFFFSRRDSA